MRAGAAGVCNTDRMRLRPSLRLAALVPVAAVAGALVVSCSSGGSPQEGSAVAATSSDQPSTSRSTPPKTSPATCVDTAIKQMPLRERLAQLLTVGVTGGQDALDIVEKEQVGGIFIGGWTDLSLLSGTGPTSLTAVKKAASNKLFVTVDQEGGRVSRLRSLGIDHPSARELAQTESVDDVRALAEKTGKAMAKLGVTVDFAPVADVSNQPDDTVIGDRSFSNDPAEVADYAGAYADGLRKAGVTPVFKHFPGHGHGSGDSHTGTVRTPPLSSLVRSDLVPYKSLLTKPGAVMLGHLIVPGLTGDELPASLNAKAVELLRTGAGYGGPKFDGVIFTDDLSGMMAVSEKYPVPEAVEMALAAGVDVALWLSTDQVGRVLDRLEGAVKAGRLKEPKINDSVRRVLTAKGVAPRC